MSEKDYFWEELFPFLPTKVYEASSILYSKYYFTKVYKNTSLQNQTYWTNYCAYKVAETYDNFFLLLFSFMTLVVMTIRPKCTYVLFISFSIPFAEYLVRCKKGVFCILCHGVNCWRRQSRIVQEKEREVI